MFEECVRGRLSWHGLIWLQTTALRYLRNGIEMDSFTETIAQDNDR